MVLVTFTWSHGGTHVFLCGSFDGWSEQIPMNLVEGSAAVFQRTVDVPPGYHKVKAGKTQVVLLLINLSSGDGELGILELVK
ncbi:hypothetical protein MTR67_015412 [Solanum verrucosum]|uniref:AMP-activated protein kinase glycogen-binding domain-containing protein n=1 Tax=Solanum verrucosum TaxID=315347 RepID=A0AAF0TIQ0_SOLVR|nr:hypothetical protein MTR67_015412 [Solanum verrucosum]